MIETIGGILVILVFLGGGASLATMAAWIYSKHETRKLDPLERAFQAPSASSRYDYPHPREETM